MSPPNSNFWSISRKKSLKSQPKHALRKKFLRTLLCPNDILNLGYSRKKLIRKRTYILDGVCFIYEQLFHPIQCTACGKLNVNVAQEVNPLSKKVFVFSHF